MKIIKLFLSVLILFLAFSLVAKNANKWEKEFTKKGITVYTRAVEGINLKEFKGVGMIDATMEDVFIILCDTTKYTKWMADCVDARLIKKIDDTQMIVYQETKAPWPVSNRDVVVFTKATIEKDKILSTIDAVKDSKVPSKGKNVRMTDLKGKWLLERKGNKTLTTYQIRANPGGMLPDWIANMASKDLPYVTLKKLRVILKK